MPKLEPIPAVAFDNTNLRSSGQYLPEWIWDGLIMPEAITLLTAPEKTGKTTLLSLLLDRRREGRRLLGRPVA
jgi:predicted AAA+ superfamily ATPase